MPLLIIAGVPASLMRRNRSYAPEVDDWDVLLVPSRSSRKADLKSCWHDVLETASGYSQGSHVFAYHNREDEYPSFNKVMHDRHRLIWMERNTLNVFGSCLYTEMIEEHLAIERLWRDKLRPRGVDAPGLLPESSFSPKSCEDMWARIRSVHLNKDDIDRVYLLTRHFRKSHYGKGAWEDSRGLRFRAAAARHGSRPPYGMYKFTYQLPEGFHYDVRSNAANRDFTINDVEGKLHRFQAYTNIDCHGSVRGGT